ncbi:P-loop containing nucleoside triphosphate hydrolase protein [Lentinula aciculospora]|uniref:Guanine nucleotide-binding protein-like 1 n=1 Tax=Lentinula aciculospora TaxID=153920 RepID=A0A9W9ALK7_9AGAR|nr:P-loop containing nucleoside triphosphate hydrolase protein [Lentinula aciculospora]
MPRRRPTSTRQKKEERQLKRAIKRGDVSPPPPTRRKAPKRSREPHGNASASTPIESSRNLQSSFIKASRQFLEDTKLIASTVPVSRPIPLDAAILPSSYEQGSNHELLSCPRRPKWRYDMSKKEVESNEAGLFRKWLQETDSALEKWRSRVRKSDDRHDNAEQEPAVIRSSSSFERNLEVWRQLWRVTEISQIILVLVDSRCPLLHYPPSLARYLSNHRVILVLTKTDITGPVRTAAWIDYLRNAFFGLRVVQVQSYDTKEEGIYHQGRSKYESRIPQIFKEQLLGAIRELHAEMLQPPEKMMDDPKRFKNWKAPVKKDIDWSAALDVYSGRAIDAPDLAGSPEEDHFLTVGLVGSPNVGKSSLLNALFGESKVRASKTPGKTKHFQTLLWTPEIRLVDCPGLVMPNYVPMEMQVLSGVLPISRVSAIPACVHYVAQLLPLEIIYDLKHPRSEEPPINDKRTWREGKERVENGPVSWTAMDILVALANKKTWITAKAGRPDFSRAGNAILRAVTEGQVHWGFWPPGTPLMIIESEGSGGLGFGIGIKQDMLQDSPEPYDGKERDFSEVDSDNDDSVEESLDDDGDEYDSESNQSKEEIGQIEDEKYYSTLATTRFTVLQLDDADVDEGESDSDFVE